MTDYSLLKNLVEDWNGVADNMEPAGDCGKMIAKAVRLCSGQLERRIEIMLINEIEKQLRILMQQRVVENN